VHSVPANTAQPSTAQHPQQFKTARSPARPPGRPFYFGSSIHSPTRPPLFRTTRTRYKSTPSPVPVSTSFDSTARQHLLCSALRYLLLFFTFSSPRLYTGPDRLAPIFVKYHAPHLYWPPRRCRLASPAPARHIFVRKDDSTNYLPTHRTAPFEIAASHCSCGSACHCQRIPSRSPSICKPDRTALPLCASTILDRHDESLLARETSKQDRQTDRQTDGTCLRNPQLPSRRPRDLWCITHRQPCSASACISWPGLARSRKQPPAYHHHLCHFTILPMTSAHPSSWD
jgi:hypothetical protein